MVDCLTESRVHFINLYHSFLHLIVLLQLYQMQVTSLHDIVVHLSLDVWREFLYKILLGDEDDLEDGGMSPSCVCTGFIQNYALIAHPHTLIEHTYLLLND
jgi:hypothetical protein